MTSIIFSFLMLFYSMNSPAMEGKDAFLRSSLTPEMTQSHYFTDGSHRVQSPTESILYDPDTLAGNRYSTVTEPTGDYFSYSRDMRDGGPLGDSTYGQTTSVPITKYDVEQRQRLQMLQMTATVLLTIDGAGAIIEGAGLRLWAAESFSAETTASINSASIRYSQSSVSGVEDIAASMRANGWQGPPVDVVQMSDGALTTFDNTRVLAANRAGINVQAVIRQPNEAFPASRWTPRNGLQPTTWEQAVQARIQQQNRMFQQLHPNGSPFTSSAQ